METNNYLDKIEELVDSYGFPTSASSEFYSKEYSLAFHVSYYLTSLKDTQKPTYSQLEECRKFVRFLTLCKGSEITMRGTMSNNLEKTIKMNNWGFLDIIQAIASFEADRLERYINEHCIEKEEPLKKNKLLGNYANGLLAILNTYGFIKELLTAQKGKGGKTKVYSFIYDALLLAGITGREEITEEGFSGDIGSDKFQEVRKWILSYEKHQNKQKD